jgi:hypothetical protein
MIVCTVNAPRIIIAISTAESSGLSRTSRKRGVKDDSVRMPTFVVSTAHQRVRVDDRGQQGGVSSGQQKSSREDPHGRSVHGRPICQLTMGLLDRVARMAAARPQVGEPGSSRCPR